MRYETMIKTTPNITINKPPIQSQIKLIECVFVCFTFEWFFFFVRLFRWLESALMRWICLNIVTNLPAHWDWTVNRGAIHIVAWFNTKTFLNTMANRIRSDALLACTWTYHVATWSFMWIECKFRTCMHTHSQFVLHFKMLNMFIVLFFLSKKAHNQCNC